jgi:peptidoglycan hydrolase-like protein with peptidoglycan-binding domain
MNNTRTRIESQVKRYAIAWVAGALLLTGTAAPSANAAAIATAQPSASAALVEARAAAKCPPMLSMRRGSRGEWVKTLQKKLRDFGYYKNKGDKVDGIFGPRTRAAVMAFQRKVGLDPDGVVGPLTWRKLGFCGNPRAQ